MKRKQLKSNSEERKETQYNSNLDFILENLPINKYKLDEEATKQVELLDKISKLLPKAKELALSAKNRLEIVESDLAKDIRKNPKNYGLDKTSDTVIYKETKAQPEYKRAFSVYLFAKTKEDEYTILLDNIRERGRMIKILTELWLNNYYTTPNVYVTKRKKPISMEE